MKFFKSLFCALTLVFSAGLVPTALAQSGSDFDETEAGSSFLNSYEMSAVYLAAAPDCVGQYFTDRDICSKAGDWCRDGCWERPARGPFASPCPEDTRGTGLETRSGCLDNCNKMKDQCNDAARRKKDACVQARLNGPPSRVVPAAPEGDDPR